MQKLNSIKCDICPNECHLVPGDSGVCGIWSNIDGSLASLYNHRISICSIDRIEKRPLFHFLPDTKTLSVGFLGCQFFCHHCENFEISKNFGEEKDYPQISPHQLVEMSKHGIKSISFSYNEPTLYPYYIEKVAELSSLPIIVKSNGFVHKSKWDLFLSSVDAWNIDIKGDENTYRNVCGGRLKDVLDFLNVLVLNNKHVEVSYLPIPQTVMDYNVHEKISDILKDISENIPVHLLYLYPNYKTTETYDKKILLDVYDIFAKKMKYVYISNVFGEMGRRNTCCKECGTVLIERSNEIKIQKYSCCGKEIDGVWAYNSIGNF